MILDTGDYPVLITVTDTATVVTVSHKKKLKPAVAAILTFGPVEDQPSGPLPGVPMQTMSATQQVTGTIQPVDHLGNPAQVQAGSSKFSSTDPSIMTVTPDPTNELVVTVKGKQSGAAQLLWSGDADLGDGVVTISLATDFTITSAQATGAVVTFGPVTEQ